MINEGNSELRFIADEMLGKLAKWLRAVGYDTAYFEGDGDSALVQQALQEDRIILTRDSGLVERKLARKSLLIKDDEPRKQFRQVVNELKLDVKNGLFTRCLVCNRELFSVEKEAVRGKVPVYTYSTQSKFYECPDCGRVFWPGTHKDSMLEVIDSMTN